LVAIDGQGALVADGFDPVEFAKGDAVVVPARIRRFRIQPRGKVQFLKSHVPGVAVGDPETV
jgi:uncharacterized protein YjlB